MELIDLLKKISALESTVQEAKDGKKPDFLDVDKDGDKKEPMTKALKDKESKKDESLEEAEIKHLLKMSGVQKKDDEEKWDNSPDEVIEPESAAVPDGTDLHKSKKMYRGSYKQGDNPMAMEGLEQKLQAMLETMAAEDNDPLQSRIGMNIVNKKPRAGQTDLSNIPVGNLPAHMKGPGRDFSPEYRKSQPDRLKADIKKSLGKHKTPNLPEDHDVVIGKGTMTYKDPMTGKDMDYMSPVTKNNPFMQASPSSTPAPGGATGAPATGSSSTVPLPPIRPVPKIPVPMPRPSNLK